MLPFSLFVQSKGHAPAIPAARPCLFLGMLCLHHHHHASIDRDDGWVGIVSWSARGSAQQHNAPRIRFVADPFTTTKTHSLITHQHTILTQAHAESLTRALGLLLSFLAGGSVREEETTRPCSRRSPAGPWRAAACSGRPAGMSAPRWRPRPPSTAVRAWLVGVGWRCGRCLRLEGVGIDWSLEWQAGSGVCVSDPAVILKRRRWDVSMHECAHGSPHEPN